MQPNDLPVTPHPDKSRTGQLIVRGNQLVEVRTVSGHPPANCVRKGDVE
jgi:hypothetical protein